jgi:GPI mannosyltransferase 3
MARPIGQYGASRALSRTAAANAPAIQHLRYRRRLAAVGLGGLVLSAVMLRLVPVILVPSLNWWDEVFQTTEQAHRLVYGYGLVPWEFQLGMRSWLLPGVIAGLIELARLGGDRPDVYLPTIAIAFAGLAAVPVICCFHWCRDRFGLAGALVAAAVLATAPELVYFGARALSEVVAAHLLLIAVFLLAPGGAAASRRRLLGAGMLLGLVCLLRVQLAPAVALIVLWPAAGGWRRRVSALLAGGFAALLLGAALDWATLGAPLASLWRPVLYNLYRGVSDDFGTQPWNYYFAGEFGLWRGGAAALLVLVAVGAWRLPILFIAAVAIGAVHSGIAHKEYRFIYPAILLAVVLAGIGMAQIACWAAQLLHRRGMPQTVAAAAVGVVAAGYWGLLALTMWNGDAMAGLRQRAADNLSATAFVAHGPSLCGLGLYGDAGRDWAQSGGYSHLHRAVPMYWPKDEAELRATAAGFDRLVYTATPPAELGFEAVRCFGRVCVAQRPGSCAAVPMPAMPYPAPIAGMAPPRERFEAISRRDGPPR